MTSVSADHMNSPCEIKTLKNEPMIIGYVGNITDDYVEIVNAEDRLPIIACNTPVKLSIYSSTGQFCGLVGKIYLSTENFIRVSDTKSVADFEKRSFFRVNVRKEAHVCVPNLDDEKHPPVIPWFPVVVKDMSLSGMLFHTEQELAEGDKIEIRMDICNTSIILKGTVIRKIEDESSSDFSYGCKLSGNQDVEINRLCYCIFQIEREEIKQTRQRME